MDPGMFVVVAFLLVAISFAFESGSMGQLICWTLAALVVVSLFGLVLVTSFMGTH